jgi:hypothetical protein
MHSSPVDEELEVAPVSVRVTADTLTVDLEDGRTISVPTAWYPRLASGTRKEWANYEVSALGIHWPDLDEDLSIRGLLLGRKSGESAGSLKFWLDARRKGKMVTLQDFVKTLRKRRSVKSKRNAG